jgi:RloB-like protein
MSAKPIKKTDKNTPWAKKQNYKNPYAIDSIPKAQTFLIICEGSNTEVEYLRSIPAPNADIKVQGGCGSKNALVKEALKLRNRNEYKGRQVWCVYDMDYKGDQVGQKEDFNSSITKAESQGLKVAYANDAFELWFVLHYKPIEQAFLRFQYYEMLSDLWQINYVEDGKKLDFCKKLYDLIVNDKRASEKQAILRAEALWQTQSHKPYADQNPCTNVFQLIRDLRGMKDA